jgi:c-di-GMP-related signal transduction protein
MLRHFSLQSIHAESREVYGYEALFRAGSRAKFSGDLDAASLVMLDNWLLYDFEVLTGGSPVFLNCTRDTLLSGFLTQLPRTAVIEVHESTPPDRAVLAACRRLKEQGYRIALDDFQRIDGQEGLLELADYVKIDFHLSVGTERIELLAALKKTGAILIGEKIETPEELTIAFGEGCDLVQGYHLGELLRFAKDRDRVSPLRCLGILERLAGRECALDEIAYWFAHDPGLEARVLHRARWASGGVAAHSTYEALELLGKSEVRKILILAMTANLEYCFQAEAVSAEIA